MITTISDLSITAAARYGNRTAVTIIGDSLLTFEDIELLAGRLAGGLASRGLQPGDRIALHLPNGWKWIVAYHAISRLGGVVIPCNILLTADEVGWITDDAEVACQIVPADRVGAIQAVQSRRPVTLSDADLDSLMLAEWVRPVSRDPDDLFTIGYTSGTTGRPKGAMQSTGQ